MKKYFGFLLCIAAAVAVPLCFAEPTRITHVVSGIHDASWASFLHEMKIPFERYHPEMEIEFLVEKDPKKVLVAMAAGGPPPDVFDLPAHLQPPFLVSDEFYDLNVFLDPATKGLFPLAMLESLTSPQGVLYA